VNVKIRHIDDADPVQLCVISPFEIDALLQAIKSHDIYAGDTSGCSDVCTQWVVTETEAYFELCVAEPDHG
jgi:hypothetical protein